MRPRVHTEKHILQRSVTAIALGAVDDIVLASCVSVPASGSAIDVREGCTISAIYCEYWVQTDDTGIGNTVLTLQKLSGAQPIMTATEAASLNAYDNKKNILYTSIGLISNNVTFPTNIVKGWFKIPKSKQRFSLGDRLIIDIFAQTNGLNYCGFAIYKEQF